MSPTPAALVRLYKGLNMENEFLIVIENSVWNFCNDKIKQTQDPSMQC